MKKKFLLSDLKELYKQGVNITEYLKAKNDVDYNTLEIIEIAYDIQAGSYINYAKANPHLIDAYTSEISKIIEANTNYQDSILDIGSGELTTLSNVLLRLKTETSFIYALEISFSRLFKGFFYAQEIVHKDIFDKLCPIVASIHEIPLLDKSVNVTISSHALEPNGSHLKKLIEELFRVTRDKLLLFEPSYEMNSLEGRKRMDMHGYIKGIPDVVKSLGGTLIEQIRIKNIDNELNPTYCYIITPPPIELYLPNISVTKTAYSVPGSNFALSDHIDYLISNETGICYPKLKGIPILKNNSSILATVLVE